MIASSDNTRFIVFCSLGKARVYCNSALLFNLKRVGIRAGREAGDPSGISQSAIENGPGI